MKDKNLNETEIVEETKLDVASEEVKQETTREEAQAETPLEEGKKVGLFGRFWQTIVRWTKRMFFGGANAWFAETKKKENEEKKEDVFAVEKIVSPGKQRIKNFLSKKLAVGATCVLALIFAVMMIGPLFNPYNPEAFEESQKNIEPGMTMMNVPGSMKDEIKSISSVSKFSVGLSESGEVAVWGSTGGLNWSVGDIPDEVKNGQMAFAAAGSDHVIAIGNDGKIYGWGQSNLGQYGPAPEDDPAKRFLYTYMKDSLWEGGVNAEDVKQLVCGMQVSAIVMKDGSVHVWGNHNNGATNLKQFSVLNNVEKMAFTNSLAVALLDDGTIFAGTTEAFKYAYATNRDGTQEKVVLTDYLTEKSLKVVDISGTRGSIALVLDNGELLISGNIFSTENKVPVLAEGEKYVSVAGGMKHYTAITSEGRVLSWGDNQWKQTNVPAGAKDAAVIYTGPFQNYAVNEDGKLLAKWGLSGYLMGTDELGRDIWNRILNGGRLTMTIGAIAVIISSIIGILVGCLSGYFGGWVDMLCMRFAEIVSAIPFMPFALILSLVVQNLGLGEGTRIVLIMVILGLLSWTGLARLVRGQVLAEREKEFVLAAKAMGVPERKIAFKHILPNIISIIIVTMTLDFAGCMLTESSLSYLGFGVQLPRPTWGNMLNKASNSIIIQNYWWQWVFPSVFLMITTICINIIGDALRDVMDPKSSSER